MTEVEGKMNFQPHSVVITKIAFIGEEMASCKLGWGYWENC